MPENAQEFLWWALNGSILIVAFYIKGDLKDIKQSLRDGALIHNDHEKRLVALETKCFINHKDDEPHR